MSEKVIVGISGGIDSAIAASLLKQEGYEVIGVHLQLFSSATFQQSLAQIKIITDFLNIPLHIIDLKDDFKKLVIDYFINSYRNAETPNPCVICNQTIKFGLLLETALNLGAKYLATGHYAKIKATDSGLHQLQKATDPIKDQSYFLCRLNQQQLSKILFPLSEITKQQVYNLAAAQNLPNFKQKESQDLCFVEVKNYRQFLLQNLPEIFQHGWIVNTAGKKLGQHQGLFNYTIGQRKGLGIAFREPLYVLHLNQHKNEVVVGVNAERQLHEVHLKDIKMLIPTTEKELIVSVKNRFTANPETAKLLFLSNQTAKLIFEQPITDATPGQFSVFYQDQTLLGSGIIRKTCNNI